MGSIGGGSSSSDSRQAQESGGPLFTPGSRLRYETSLPVAAAYTQGLPLAQSLAGKTTSYALPELTSSGLYGEQQNAFTEAIKQAMSRVSGNFAQRGFLRPENIQAVAGSAAQNVLPQFAPLIGQNIQARAQIPLMQQQLDANRLNFLMNYLGLGANLLGGQAQSFGQSGSQQAGGNLSILQPGGDQDKAKCWIAAVFYGEGSSEQALIRWWLDTKAATSWHYRLFVRIYEWYGRSIAATLCHDSVWRRWWGQLFAYFLREASHAIHS